MNEWVLIVDDDVDALRIASRILAAKQKRVSSIRSGAEAIAFLNGLAGGKLPDLLLLDTRYSRASGKSRSLPSCRWSF